jgi:hypothetical protein
MKYSWQLGGWSQTHFYGSHSLIHRNPPLLKKASDSYSVSIKVL